METVKLSSKGQIVIPKNMRESHRMPPGTEFHISFVGQEIRLVPVPMFPPTTPEQAAGCLYQPGRKKMSDTELDDAIGAMLKAQDDATKSKQ